MVALLIVCRFSPIVDTLLLLRQDCLHSPNLTGIQPHFDPARMVLGRSQDVLHNPDRSLAAALILLQDNFNAQARPNIFALLSSHQSLSLQPLLGITRTLHTVTLDSLEYRLE